MRKTDYKNKCGTCQHAEPIFDTRSCYCTARKYDEDVFCNRRHPYPVMSLSHIRCRDYQPVDYTDGAIERDVLGFIGRFSMAGTGKPRQEVIEAFTCGCCFWFARILEERFVGLNPVIMTDYVENHFGTQIAGRVYDITGDVTEGHKWEPWSECEDASLVRRITEYCIYF